MVVLSFKFFVAVESDRRSSGQFELCRLRATTDQVTALCVSDGVATSAMISRLGSASCKMAMMALMRAATLPMVKACVLPACS